MAAALFCFFLSAGNSDFISLNAVREEKNKYFLPSSYNKQSVLESEKRRLDVLLQQKEEMKKICIYRIPLMAAGVIFYLSYFLILKLLGIFFIVVSIKCIWRYFINSDIKIAVKIARIFEMNTLSRKIEECKGQIDSIKHMDYPIER